MWIKSKCPSLTFLLFHSQVHCQKLGPHIFWEKSKKGNLTKVESGAGRGSLWLAITDSNRWTDKRKESLATDPTGKDCLSYMKLTTHATQPWETIIPLNFCFPPTKFPSKQPLPTSSFSIKNHFSPLFIGFASGFSPACASQVVILCNSWINFFCW